MTTALYRRYRPETFAEVIGQEHVTTPLMAALRHNRVNHAYLFSGPRGCGKTTSARILARCLNCAEGPTDTPCGHCESCRELARDGSGSLDVVEIDAASHGGVDDAREIRERAVFAPARDRYKVFIIDEAHMVTPQGFNALLKIVEEPPEHVKFIFATTEPDKVIGTIRSRTHHYPFRLVPPALMVDYLQEICGREHVEAGPAVLPLVVRAGGGSVRDSLSVLDQLIAGSPDGGIDYERAVALLGYTDATLLDDMVTALSAGDGATVFRTLDRVIDSGHDPRRFVEDLLERFRDLVVIRAVRDDAAAVLPLVPADALARMQQQAGAFGAAELSRAADVTNAALTEMTGATSPRIQLELLCARLLLPAVDDAQAGVAARVDRIERRLAVGQTGVMAAAPVAAPAAVPSDPPAPRAATAAPAGPAPVPAAPATASPTEAAPVHDDPPPAPDPAHDDPAHDDDPEPEPPAPVAVARVAAAPTPAPRQQAPAPVAPAPESVGATQIEMFRRTWPDVLDALARIRRASWALVSANAQCYDYDGQTLRLLFDTEGRAHAFRAGQYAENVQAAIGQAIGVSCRVEAVSQETLQREAPRPAQRPGSRAAEGGAAAVAPRPPAPAPAVSARPAPVPATVPPATVPPAPEPGPEAGPAADPEDDPAEADPAEAVTPDPAEPGPDVAADDVSLHAEPEPPEPDLEPIAPEDEVPSDDDPDIVESGLVGIPAVEKVLGGKVLEDVRDEDQP